ncbi:MAG: tetratricopeptide repeat protein [Opitutaceae bacterium]|nr:tetratricopeptide repeat protein [Opitutaceae bacterium]
MSSDTVQAIIEDATFDFTMGENTSAITKLKEAIKIDSQSFAAWHALAEIQFSERRFDEALEAAEKAHSINPDDVFINTSLSRIWMEKGDKAEAEKFGAQAKILGWKDQLANPSKTDENLA